MDHALPDVVVTTGARCIHLINIVQIIGCRSSHNYSEYRIVAKSILISMCHLQKVHAQAGPLAVADQDNAKNDQDSGATGKYFTTRKRNKVKRYVPTGQELWNLKEEGGETQQNCLVIVEQSSDVVDILIIGAGWAGATAAKTLINAGRTNIKVLEGRDYTGGRTRSVMESVWEGEEDYPVDIGSQWILGITSILFHKLPWRMEFHIA